MVVTTAMLRDELNRYADPANKIARMVRGGELVPIVKGLYETNPDAPACALAGCIYGPSYISFEYALAFHDLIPEAARVVTCATFEKGKRKRHETPFGTFTYRDVPAAAFPWGLQVREEGPYAFRIASPEKALCDMVYALPPVANRRDMEALLLEDLRLDEDGLSQLDRGFVGEMAERYRSGNVRRLARWLRGKERP